MADRILIEGAVHAEVLQSQMAEAVKNYGASLELCSPESSEYEFTRTRLNAAKQMHILATQYLIENQKP